MPARNNKKSGKKTGPSSRDGQKPRTYSGVVKSPQSKKITGTVYLKENGNSNGVKYGTIIVLAVLAGMAATFSSIGNAVVDFLGIGGIPASGIWVALASIAGFVGFVFAYLDWSTKGKI